MTTDSERREVARRLRERAGKRVLNLSELRWCIGCDDGDNAAAWNRLADLIEPPTQCPYYHSDRHHCSAYDDVVDRDALLALADEMTWCYEGAASAEGDGTVGAWAVMQYAGRIREALGVSDD